MLKRSGWAIVPAAFFFAVNFSLSPVKILFFSRLTYFLFLLSLFLLLRNFNLNKILKPVVGGISCILFAYGLIQKFFLFPFYLKTLSLDENFYSQAVITRIKSGRIFSLFALPTLYAIVCAVLILFIFHYLLKSTFKKARIFWALLLVLGMSNLVLTQSFGGILYLSVGISLFLILAGILNLKYMPAVVIVLALFFFLIIGLRFSEARELEPVKLRLSNWHQAVRMIESSPFWGVGPGNYESEISYFTRPGEARSMYAHNFFLQFTAESGILVTLFILLSPFFFKRKLEIKDCRDKVVYISAFLILIFYNLIDIGFYFFSAGIAGSICLSQIYLKDKDRFKLNINIAVLVLLSLLLLAENISDTYQKRADFWLNQKDYVEAGNNYKISLKINKFNIRSLVGCAAVHYFQKDFTNAEYYLDRVLAIHPGAAYANYLKSKIQMQRGRYFSAFYHAQAAYDKNRINRQSRKWYETIKDKLQVELARSQD